MFGKTFVASLAFLAVISANTLEVRDKKAPKLDQKCAEFDYEALSLREMQDWCMYLLHRDPRNKNIIKFVVEVLRWTNGKIETRRPEALNLIFHDDKDGALRYVERVWPHKSYPSLYGSIPQTWENPKGFLGDKVKLLGGLAVNDGDETDWKMLGIDVKDPLAALVKTYEDVEEYRPGTVQAFRDWFTYYKVARGDDIIPIIGETYQNVSFVVGTVEESHKYGQDLINPSSWIPCKDARKELDILKKSSKPQAPADKPERYDWWYYLGSEKNLIEAPGSLSTDADL